MNEYVDVYGEKFKFDEDFPIQFCPVCGSDDTTCSGNFDYLCKKRTWNMYCNNCHWNIFMHLLKKGKIKFKVRADAINCKVCQKEQKKLEKL